MKNLTFKILIILFTVTSLCARAQNASGTIAGVVHDGATGETMPGVNVVIEGTLRGASTDSEGVFTISSVTPGII